METIRLEIPCGHAGTRKRVKHAVSIAADWSIEVPHDLAAERVALAFGGSEATCVTLADRDLPAVRDLRASIARSMPPPIRPVENGRFTVVTPITRGCECAKGQPWSAPACGEHLRTIQHWAKHHATTVSRVEKLFVTILEAWGPVPERPGAASIDRAAELLHGLDGVRELWAAGVHPDLVIEVHHLLDPREDDGPAPLAPHTILLALAGDGVRQPWVESFRGLPPPVVVQALRHRQDLADLDADLVRAWIDAGVLLGDAVVLVRAHWSLDGLDRAARRLGWSRLSTARIAAQWHTAGCTTASDELVETYLDPHVPPLVVPNAAALAKVRERCGVQLHGVPELDVARALLRSGSVDLTVAFVKRVSAPRASSSVARGSSPVAHAASSVEAS